MIEETIEKQNRIKLELIRKVCDKYTPAHLAPNRLKEIELILDGTQLGSEIESLQDAIHYPICWDTMTYPTFLDALKEIGCSMGDQCVYNKISKEVGGK